MAWWWWWGNWSGSLYILLQCCVTKLSVVGISWIPPTHTIHNVLPLPKHHLWSRPYNHPLPSSKQTYSSPTTNLPTDPPSPIVTFQFLSPFVSIWCVHNCLQNSSLDISKTESPNLLSFNFTMNSDIFYSAHCFEMSWKLTSPNRNFCCQYCASIIHACCH